jgi:amidase
MAEKAASLKAQITSQLPQHSLLSKNVALPLDSTTLIEFSNRLSKTQIEIISLDACSLVEALKKKKYTAVETTEAYCIAASLAHQALNCLTWYDSQSALKQAKELDEYLEKNSKVKGPLHGVIISIKRECKDCSQCE